MQVKEGVLKPALQVCSAVSKPTLQVWSAVLLSVGSAMSHCVDELAPTVA